MLKENEGSVKAGAGLQIAIVASRYNEAYVGGMLDAATAYLKGAGAGFEIIRVPGAFEIPVAAAAILRRKGPRPDAVICLGVIWQGETDHAQHIGSAVTQALMALQTEVGVPCIHEVLTVRSEEQARARCLEPRSNRGTEAAATAVEMGNLFCSLQGRGSSPG